MVGLSLYTVIPGRRSFHHILFDPSDKETERVITWGNIVVFSVTALDYLFIDRELTLNTGKIKVNQRWSFGINFYLILPPRIVMNITLLNLYELFKGYIRLAHITIYRSWINN